MFSLAQFQQILPNCKEPEEWHSLLQSDLAQYGVNTVEQIAAFLAQTAHESSEYNILAENLNYSGNRLAVIFPKYFKNVDTAKFHRNPGAIANKVYANRMGNGDEASGEGYRYRGRGVLQITGKNNYAKCSSFMFGADDVLLDDPDLLLEKSTALGSAFWFWDQNKLKDVSNFILLTKKINGGTNGLPHRQELYNRAQEILR